MGEAFVSSRICGYCGGKREDDRFLGCSAL
jgi:hypothetical protein